MPEDGAEVSRETDRPPDDVVRTVFGAHTEGIYQFVDILTSRGVDHGLIGPREAPRIWHRHVLNCAAIAGAFPTDAWVIDIGSGAGLPGVVVALARPDLSLVLLEPLLRRATFLQDVLNDLDLPRVSVERSRAEDLIGRRQFDAATARAVAPLARLARWALPLVRSGGHLVAMKGSSVSEEISTAASVLRELRAGAVVVEEWSPPGVDLATTVVRIESSGLVPRRRKAGP